MRRGVLALVTLFALVALASAQTKDDWRHWKFNARIQLGDRSGDRLVAVTVPPAVMESARTDLADLRVVDDEEREVPYALRARTGGAVAEWKDARLLDPSRADRAFVQVIADTGEQARVHNAARLAFDGGDDFLSWIEIAVSDDARAWRVLRERAPVYQLHKEGMGEQLTLTYPETPSRYLRMRILDGATTERVRRVETAYEVTTATELGPAPLVFSATSARPQQSAWIASGAARVPIATFTVATSQPLFDRPVAVEISSDGVEWRHLAASQIYRTVEHGQSRESLEVRIPETTSAYWRVTVFNRNDAPLPDFTVRANTIPRRIVFRPQAGRQYSLLYGNEEAKPADYEFARLTDAATLDQAAAVTVANGETNANYTDPAPWTERHPVIVWSALVIVVIVLGGLALRTLKPS